MSFKTHFYFGEKSQAFQTGLGTIIRALGQGIQVKIVIYDDGSDWIKDLKNSTSFTDNNLLISSNKEKLGNYLSTILELQNHVILISNIHLIFNEPNFSEAMFQVISMIKQKNEVILTSETKLERFIEIADYVSSFSIKS